MEQFFHLESGLELKGIKKMDKLTVTKGLRGEHNYE